MELYEGNVAFTVRLGLWHQGIIQDAIVGSIAALRMKHYEFRRTVPNRWESVRFSSQDCFEINPNYALCPCTRKLKHGMGTHQTQARPDREPDPTIIHVSGVKTPKRFTAAEALECCAAETNDRIIRDSYNWFDRQFDHRPNYREAYSLVRLFLHSRGTAQDDEDWRDWDEENDDDDADDSYWDDGEDKPSSSSQSY